MEVDEDETSKIDWEELTKLTVINHVIEQQERDLLYQTVYADAKATVSKSESTMEPKNSEDRIEKRYSCSELEGNVLLTYLPCLLNYQLVYRTALFRRSLNNLFKLIHSFLPDSQRHSVENSRTQ